MAILILTIALTAVAVWRISYMLVNEDGPFDLFSNFRLWVASKTGAIYDFLDSLFACIYCMSVWVGIAATILYAINPTILFYLSLPFIFSACAIFIDYRMSKNG